MFPPSIGILIENPSFVSNYTAFENLKTLASIRKRIDDNRIRETLTEIGLDPDDKRTFHKFSLGMKQRLGIAAAIMENPDIIILMNQSMHLMIQVQSRFVIYSSDTGKEVL